MRFIVSFTRLTLLTSFLISLTSLSALAEVPLIARWTFDDGLNLDTDIGPNQYVGQVVGVTAVNGRTLPGGGSSGAAKFDGNDYIRVTGFPIQKLKVFTLEAWVNVNSAATNIFRAQQPIAFHSNFLYVYNPAGGWQNLMTSAATPMNSWYHLAAVFDHGEMRLYINGRLSNVSVMDFEEVNTPNTYGEWGIGARLVGASADQYFNGTLDDLALYDGALSATQILANSKDIQSSNVILATNHGVVGDGTTDDASAINTFLQNHVPQGGEAFFPSGTYRLGDTIQVPSNIMIRGESDTIFKPLDNSGNNASPAFLLNDVEDVTLRDFQIHGNAGVLSQSSGHAGIWAVGVRRMHLDRIIITNLGRSSASSGGVHILLEAFEPGLGITIGGVPAVEGTSSERNIIENCRLMDSPIIANFGIRLTTNWLDIDPGMSTVFNQDNVIKNNHLEGFHWNAIEIAGPATKENLIRRNVSLAANVVGIEADKGSSDNRFTDNVVQMAGRENHQVKVGMRDQGFPRSTGNHLATGNEFRRNIVHGVISAKRAGGILLSYAKDGIFEDNFLRDIEGPNPNQSAAILIDEGTLTNYQYNNNQTANVSNYTIFNQ